MTEFDNRLQQNIEAAGKGVIARRLLPVLVAFDSSGIMKPVRVQIDKDIYTVSMCYLSSAGGPNITYTCDVQCQNTHGTIDITYMKTEKKWYMEY